MRKTSQGRFLECSLTLRFVSKTRVAIIMKSVEVGNRWTFAAKAVIVVALYGVNCQNGLQAQVASFSNAALGGGNATQGTTVSATTLTTGFDSGVVARGAGASLPGNPGSSRYNSSGFNVADAAAAISGNKFVNITFTPSANYTYSLTSLGLTLGTSGTGPGTWGLYAGVPGFSASTQLATGAMGTITPSLSGGFSNLTAATEIRFYAWGASSSAGTFGPGNGDALDVFGSVILRTAGDLIWDGGRGNGDWDSYSAIAANQSNWNLNNIPTAALVDSLQFAGSTQTTTNNNISGLTVGSIAFNSGASAFTVGGNAITLNSGIANNSSNLQTVNLNITLGGLQSFDAASGNLAIGSAIANGSNTLTVTGSNNTAISGVIGSGSGGLVKNGAGTLTLSGANTYTGDTTVSAGKLIVSSTGVINSSANATSNLSVTGGELQIDASGAVTVGNAGSGATFSGSSVATVNGTLTAPTVTMNGTSTLQGTGTVVGNTTVGSSAILGPGNSIGTLTVTGNLTVNGTNKWEVNSGTSAADITVVTGNLDLSTTDSKLEITQLGTFTVGQKFTVMAYAGTLTGTFSSILNGSGWTINYADSTGGLNTGGSGTFITLMAVPEVGSMTLVGLVSIGSVLIGTRRRRRSG